MHLKIKIKKILEMKVFLKNKCFLNIKRFFFFFFFKIKKMNFGFSSLPYEDNISKLSYVKSLPLLAEILNFDTFFHEIDLILTSIIKNNLLINKFLKFFNLIINKLDPYNSTKIIYLTGQKICISLENSIKQLFLNLIEEILEKSIIKSDELEFFIQPNLGLNEKSKFSIWRLCRLSILRLDITNFESLIFNEFTILENLNFSSEFLSFININLLKKILNYTLISSNENVRINSIYSIIKNSNELNPNDYFIYFLNEKSSKVLKNLLNLPINFLNNDIFLNILNDQNCFLDALKFALSTSFFHLIIPIIKENGCIGCEINNLNFESIKNLNEIPYDILGNFLLESQEFIKKNIINELLQFNEEMILYKLIFPRMNEKKQWRSRYNALLIFKEIVIKDQNNEFRIEYISFIIAMIMDHVYLVRELSFDILLIFKNNEMKEFILDSILQLIDQDFNDLIKNILIQMILKCENIILKFPNLNNKYLKIKKILKI